MGFLCILIGLMSLIVWCSWFQDYLANVGVPSGCSPGQNDQPSGSDGANSGTEPQSAASWSAQAAATAGGCCYRKSPSHSASCVWYTYMYGLYVGLNSYLICAGCL